MDLGFWIVIFLCLIFLGIVFYLSIIILKNSFKHIINNIKCLISYFRKQPKVFIALCTTSLVFTGVILTYQYYLYQDKQKLIEKGYCYETRTQLTDKELYQRAMLEFLSFVEKEVKQDRDAEPCSNESCAIFIANPLTAEELLPYYQKYFSGTQASSVYIDFSYDDIAEKFEFLKKHFSRSTMVAIEYLVALNAKKVDDTYPINNPIYYELKNNRWTIIFSFSGYLYVLPKDCCSIVDGKAAVEGWGSEFKNLQYDSKYLQMHIAWNGETNSKEYFPYLIDSCGYLMENPFKSED